MKGDMPFTFQENIRRLLPERGSTADRVASVVALLGEAACTGEERLRFLLVGGGLMALRRSFMLDFALETLAVMLYFGVRYEQG
jgi:hypothetical protein